MAITAAYSPNPIISREVRSRWRGRAWTYVFAYSLGLAVMIGGYYYFIVADSHNLMTYQESDFKARGQTLFLVVSCIQLITTMLLAPALTATAIVSEREQGMLEAMQLTPLPPWRIIVGKLLSIFFFLLTMLLVPLPVIAISFILGGVSPLEFCLVFLLQIVTAATCSIIGLTCSARCRRSGTALFIAFFFTIGWLVLSYVALLLLQKLQFLVGPVAWIGPGMPMIRQIPWWHGVALTALEFAVQSNPLIALLSVLQPDLQKNMMMPGQVPTWGVNLLFQSLLSLLLLWLATRAVSKPLASPGEKLKARKKEAKPFLPRRSTPDRSTPTRSTPDVVESAIEDDIAREPAPNVLLKPIRLPVSRLRFSNPVLQRESQARFQIKPANAAQRRLASLLTWLGIFAYLFLLWDIVVYADSMRAAFWVMWGVGLMMLAAVVMGAMAFTREREGNTWESLRLSLLTPRQIIAGKAGAVLVTCLLYSLPMWPLLLIWFARLSLTNRPLYATHFDVTLALPSAVGASIVSLLLLVPAALWCCIACGMIFSWFQRSTPAAIGWAIMALAVSSIVAVVGPWSWANYLPYEITSVVTQLIHPSAALYALLQRFELVALVMNNWSSNGLQYLPFSSSMLPFEPWLGVTGFSVLAAATNFGVGQILLSIIYRDMKRKVDRDMKIG